MYKPDIALAAGLDFMTMAYLVVTPERRAVWANAPADASFTVQVTSDEDRRTFRARSDAEGRLQCSLPLNGPVSIAFSVDATDQL